jgi:hypothetical protein
MAKKRCSRSHVPDQPSECTPSESRQNEPGKVSSSELAVRHRQRSHSHCSNRTVRQSNRWTRAGCATLHQVHPDRPRRLGPNGQPGEEYVGSAKRLRIFISPLLRRRSRGAETCRLRRSSRRRRVRCRCAFAFVMQPPTTVATVTTCWTRAFFFADIALPPCASSASERD